MSSLKTALTADFTANGGASIAVPKWALAAGFGSGVSRETFPTAAGWTAERGMMYAPSGSIYDYSLADGFITEMVARREGTFTFTHGDATTNVYTGRHTVRPVFTDKYCELFVGLAAATGNPTAGTGWTSAGILDGGQAPELELVTREDGKGLPYFKYWRLSYETVLPFTTRSALDTAGFDDANVTDDNQVALKLPDDSYLMLDNMSVSVITDGGESPDGVRGVRLRVQGASATYTDLYSFTGTPVDHFNSFELSMFVFAFASDDTAAFTDSLVGP